MPVLELPRALRCRSRKSTHRSAQVRRLLDQARAGARKERHLSDASMNRFVRGRIYRTAETVPQSGIYEIVHSGDHREPHSATLISGEPFPDCEIRDSNPRGENVYWGWGRSRKSLRVISSPPGSTSTASSFAHTTSPSFASRITSLEGMHREIHHILSELQAEPAPTRSSHHRTGRSFSWLCPSPGPPCKARAIIDGCPTQETMSAAARAKISAAGLLPPKPARAKGGIMPETANLANS